ncbi:MAG: hypothetical protein H6835_06405 [Planctomycetes bacterium]|nr:hypothetical protein [Planctomycetota bacterium]
MRRSTLHLLGPLLLAACAATPERPVGNYRTLNCFGADQLELHGDDTFLLSSTLPPAWAATGQWTIDPTWGTTPSLTLILADDRPEVLSTIDTLGLTWVGDEVEVFAVNGVVDLGW